MSIDWEIPLSDVSFDERESKAVLGVLRSGWLTMGGQVQTFEEEFVEAAGCRHAIAVSSGTAGLHLALLALDIGPGDEVIQPAVNFIASANMTLAVGAAPVFADITALETPTLDPGDVERRITSRTKAVVAMHYGGFPADVARLRELCRAHDIALIEDACHAVGAEVEGAGMGSWGAIGAFSFFSNKNMVTGEGGMVTTGDDSLADSVRRLRSHGMTTLTWDRHKGHAYSYDVLRPGFNYRIDELRAALGRVQLGKLAEFNDRRRKLMEAYRERFAPLEERGWMLAFRDAPLWPRASSCHLCAAVAPSREVRDAAQRELKSRRIQSSLHYPFIPAFSAFSEGDEAWRETLTRSEAFCEREITLPLFPAMTESMVERVLEGVVTSAKTRQPSR